MRRTTAPALVLALALLVSGPRAGADPASDAACFFTKANEARTARGYPALTTDPTLTSLAGAQAQEMARISRAVPIDNDTLVAKAPPEAQVLGQNVGVGADCEGLHETFINYPADQNRILDPRFDKIGVGVVSAGDVIYVSEILMQSGPARPGKPRASVAPAPPPVVRASPSPAPSRAASPSPVETAASPAPSVVSSESPAAPSVPVAPSPSVSVQAERVSKSRGVPLLVAFALMIVGAAALGALVQTRRSRR